MYLYPFQEALDLEDVTDKIKWNICRDSPEDKLRDLMKWMKAVKRDAVHMVHAGFCYMY